jgi:hypothetical protein
LTYYFIAIFSLTLVFAFKNGILFALSFLGTTTLPAISITAMRWAIARGNRAQKIGVPIFGALLVAFAYWLSLGVSGDAFGLHVSGQVLLVISGVVGFFLPLALAE